MNDNSDCAKVWRAVLKGWRTVEDIAAHAHLSKADTRTYLTRLAKRGLVEREPAKYSPKAVA